MTKLKPLKAPATRPTSSALAVVGLDSPVEVRRHPSARRLTLRVSQTRRTVIVTVPTRCRMDEAGSFVHRNLDWVRARLCDIPTQLPFVDGMDVPVRGVAHRVVFDRSRSPNGDIVRVSTSSHGKPILIVHGRPEHCARRLKDWLYGEAKADLDLRVLYHARRLGLKPKRIALRDQASRWGSCSSTGVLSFSWRLVLAPPMILDYVAAHEVAHLAEMNHGARFWALVRQTMPQTDAAKAWLTKHGLELHRYGVMPAAGGPTRDIE